MKSINYFAIALLFVWCSCTQNQPQPVKQELTENVRFKMFPTENIWTFLKLDTRTGRIWQVQYSLDNNNRGEVELNNKELVTDGNAENGRFTLYPTKNMFNFILLDQTNGKMWQAQWSMEDENRGIIPFM